MVGAALCFVLFWEPIPGLLRDVFLHCDRFKHMV